MSEQDKTGGPAFCTLEQDGMSLRDYFASKAMQGMLSGHFAHYGHDNYWNRDSVADEAYGVADAMLAARKL